MIKNIFGKAFFALASHVFSRGSMMICALLAARGLSHADYAAFAYFQITISMVAVYSSLGLGITASKFFAEWASGVNRPIGELIKFSWLIAFVFSVAIALMPAGLMTAGLNISPLCLAIGVLLLVLNVVPAGATLGLQLYKKVVLVSTLSGAAMIVTVAWGSSNNSLNACVAGTFLGLTIQFVGELLLVSKVVGWGQIFGEREFDFGVIKEIVGFSGPMILVTALSASGPWVLGRILLSNADGDYLFGVYSICLHWFSLALLLPGILSRVTLPVMIYERVANDGWRLARSAAVSAIVISSLLLIIALCFGGSLDGFYGNKYDGLGVYIPLFFLVALIASPINIVANHVMANNKQVIWLFYIIIWLASLLLVAIELRDYGILGVVWAQLVAYCVLMVLAVRYAIKESVFSAKRYD